MKVHFRMLADFSIEVPDDATEAEREQSLKEVRMNLESIIPNDVGNGNITSTDQDFDLELNGYQVVVVQMKDMSRYRGPEGLEHAGNIDKFLNEDDILAFKPNLRARKGTGLHPLNEMICLTGDRHWLKVNDNRGVKWKLLDPSIQIEYQDGQ